MVNDRKARPMSTVARKHAASQQLYDSLARVDPRAISPLIRPLVQDFVQSASLPAIEGLVLDVGTGLGFAAHILSELNQYLAIVGLDLSAAMLRVARSYWRSANFAQFVCANIMQPPFAPDIFDLITASFGLNLTVPRQSLPLLRRLLKPGGRLLIQEWAAEDVLSATFDQIFEAHTVPDPALEQLLADLPDDWSLQMQDVDDYRDQLQAAGFVGIQVSEGYAAPIHLESAATFIAYKLAWPTYSVRWDQLDSVSQRVLAEALMFGLQPWTSDKQLVWQPMVFRAMAQKDV